MIVLPIHPNPTTLSSMNVGENYDEDDTPQEWSLLELNGELLPPRNLPSTSTAGAHNSNTAEKDHDDSRVELGSIHFDSEGTPVMTIGSHELKGKVQYLKQPFVVMRQQRIHQNHDTNKKNKRLANTSNQEVEEEEICQDHPSKRMKLNGISTTTTTTTTTTAAAAAAALEAMPMEEEDDNEKHQEKGYEITGIIRKKLLFDTYPKSIMR